MTNALATAKLAYERAPQSASIIDTYGWVLALNGEPQKRLALLRQAYSRLSTESAIRYHIGLALSLIAGREAEAKEELSAALSAQGAKPARWADDATRVLKTVGKAK